MARYQEDFSDGSMQRRSTLLGYATHVDSNVRRATFRQPEMNESGGRRIGPFGFNAGNRAESNPMASDTQQHAWRPDFGPMKEDPYSEQRESRVFKDGVYGLSEEGPYTSDWKDRGRSRPLSPLSNRPKDQLSYMNHIGDFHSYHGLSREREVNAYPSLSREREMNAYPSQSREQEMKAYPSQPREQEMKAYPSLSREQEMKAYPSLSREQEMRAYPSLSREQEMKAYPSLPREQEMKAYPSLSREQDMKTYPSLTREQEVKAYPSLSREQEMKAYPSLSREQEMKAYPSLSREQEIKAYHSLSREREPYYNLHSDQISCSDLPREQLPFQDPVRDLPPHTSLASNLASDQREDGSLDGNNYSRRLPQYGLTEERLPQSSPSVYKNSRSRSPLGNRDLSLESEVPGHSQSPYYRERLPVLPSKTNFRQEVMDGGSSRSVQSMKKDGRFADKRKTGSVVRVDGFPAENEAGCITKLLARLGAYGTVTDVQLHKAFEGDYALFFYSDGNAAYVALENVKKNPLFLKSLKLSVWVLEADRDKPLTITLTRVMYMENLDKTVSLEMLHSLCGKVGEILDIELKETPGSSFNTAIVQYWDASNAKIAAQALNKEKIGKNVIKTTSGKNTPSNCVWIDGLPNDIDRLELTNFFEQYGLIEKYLLDRERGAALILFPTRVPARQCVRSLENGKTALGGQLIRADYANRRAQLAFCKAMEQSGQDVDNFLCA